MKNKRGLFVLGLVSFCLLLAVASPAFASKSKTYVTGLPSNGLGVYTAAAYHPSGTLTYAKGSRRIAVSRQYVRVYRYSSGAWRYYTKVRTSTKGKFSLALTTGYRYQVKYLGSSRLKSSASAQFRLVDPRNTVYAVDTYNNRVQVFNRSGAYLFQFGSYGTSAGYLANPFSIARDGHGNVYVTDSSNNRVQKFSCGGKFISAFGSYGHLDGMFSKPEGIAVDKASNSVYVVDMSNQRVQKFDTSGRYISQWGQSGSTDGRFSNPSQISLDASGNVYIVDSGNYRVQKFDAAGNYLTQWGSAGSGNGQFGFGMYGGAWGIAISPESVVYVVDYANCRVQSFDTTGTYLAQWGSQGSGNGQFMTACQVSVDASSNVYVSDVVNCRVQKFDAAGNYLTQWGSQGSGSGQFAYSPQGLSVASARARLMTAE